MSISKQSLFRCVLIGCLLYMVTAVVFYLASTTTYVEDSRLTNVRLGILILLAPVFIKYIVQLIAAPFYTLIESFRAKKGEAPKTSSVTVLIPAWNEEVGILKTIRSVLNTGYENLEIIIINDGSTDNTHKLVSGFITAFEKNTQQTSIKYLRLTNGGKANALNQALKLASGEFVMTVDADSVMDKNAIKNILKYFIDKQVAAVAGNVIIGNRSKPIEIMQQLEYLYGFFFKRADSIFNSVYIIGGAAAIYRKKVLLEVGGFDTEIITEDIELSTRILGHGYKTRYAADAVIYTEGPSDWKGLCNQRLRWKFGRLLTFIKHRNLFFSGKNKHNPYLTFMLLPLAIYSEFVLLFEGLLLTIFYGYTIYTNDYLSLLFVISLISTVIILQIITDPNSLSHLNLLPLAPVAWIIFYVIDFVEFQALVRSLHRFSKRENIVWQKWSRIGFNHQSQQKPVANIAVKYQQS